MSTQREVRMAVLADQDPIPQDVLDEDLDTLRKAARIIYPGVGDKLYDWWEAFNEEYFGQQMTPPGIQFGLTAHGGSFGKWRGHEQTIILHRSLLDATDNAWGKGHKLGKRFARDVLLHEMIHQYIDTVREIDSPRSNSPSGSVHNCPSWAAEINRLSAELGLDCKAHVVKQRRVNGQVKWAPPEGFDMSIDDMSSWPHSVRADEYYTEDPNPALSIEIRDRIQERMEEMKQEREEQQRRLEQQTEQSDSTDEHSDEDEQGKDKGPAEKIQELEDELNDLFQRF